MVDMASAQRLLRSETSSFEWGKERVTNARKILSSLKIDKIR